MPHLLAIVKFDGTSPDDQQVLLQSSNKLFPSLPDGIDKLKPETGDACAVIKSKLQLGFDLAFLRTVYPKKEDSSKSLETGNDAMHVVEALGATSAASIPTDLRWIPAKNSDADAVGRYLENFKSNGFRGDERELRIFERAGWYCQARDWIESHLKEFEVSSVFQKRVSVSSCVLEVSTTCGKKFFFKASSSTWLTDEAAATHAVGVTMESDFEGVVSVDPVRNWVLMRKYGEDMRSHLCHMLDCGTSEERERNLAVMNDVLEQWGDIQMRSVRKTAQLIREGIPKADEKWLSRKIVEMTDCSFWHEAQCVGDERKGLPRLTPEERKKKLTGLIGDLWKNIEEYDIPLALVHGDLLSDNVCVKNARGRYMFYDFGCIMISHPFLDAVNLCSAHGGSLKDISSEYLRRWDRRETEDRLRELLAQVDKLTYVFGAINMFFFYVNGDASRKEFFESDLQPSLISFIS